MLQLRQVSNLVMTSDNRLIIQNIPMRWKLHFTTEITWEMYHKLNICMEIILKDEKALNEEKKCFS